MCACERKRKTAVRENRKKGTNMSARGESKTARQPDTDTDTGTGTDIGIDTDTRAEREGLPGKAINTFDERDRLAVRQLH